MFRDILVHVKAHEAWSAHIGVAAMIAKTFDAQLTGLFTEAEIAILKAIIHGPGGGEEILERRVASFADGEAKMRRLFEAEMVKNGVKWSWDVAEGRANEVLALAGRFHDLIVVEQTDRSRDEYNFVDVEEAAARCGRPTLIVPRSGSYASVGKRVLIAWNDSVESARALHAGMAFVQRAEAVFVLQGRGRERFGSITRMPGADIERYLGRHAASVTLDRFDGPDEDAGKAIIDAAMRHKADLVIMGAFGRRGLAQWILGGATEHVLQHMAVPTLMEH